MISADCALRDGFRPHRRLLSAKDPQANQEEIQIDQRVEVPQTSEDGERIPQGKAQILLRRRGSGG